MYTVVFGKRKLRNAKKGEGDFASPLVCCMGV